MFSLLQVRNLSPTFLLKACKIVSSVFVCTEQVFHIFKQFAGNRSIFEVSNCHKSFSLAVVVAMGKENVGRPDETSVGGV